MTEHQKEFDTIMEEIRAGLTGNPAQDRVYLSKQSERYKNHALAKEIVRECSRMIYDLIPDEQKRGLDQALAEDADAIKRKLNDVQTCLTRRDYKKALEILDFLREMPEHLFHDDEVNEYHSFEEPFEEILYQHWNKPVKTLRRVPVPYHDIYYLYGYIMIEQKNFSDAEQALKSALRWNPMNAKVFLEYTEIFKKTGRQEKSFRLSVDAFQRAFHPDDLARCYRSLGYCFIEKTLWQEAAACYSFSLYFDPDSRMARNELFYIQQKSGLSLEKPASISDMKVYAKKYGFPVGPHPDIIGLSHAYGKVSFDSGQWDTAKYFLNINYALTKLPEIKAMLDRIPAQSG